MHTFSRVDANAHVFPIFCFIFVAFFFCRVFVIAKAIYDQNNNQFWQAAVLSPTMVREGGFNTCSGAGSFGHHLMAVTIKGKF